MIPAVDATCRNSLFWPMMMPTSAARRGEMSEAESPMYAVRPLAPASIALLSSRSSRTLDLSAPLCTLLQQVNRQIHSQASVSKPTGPASRCQRLGHMGDGLSLNGCLCGCRSFCLFKILRWVSCSNQTTPPDELMELVG